MTTEEYTQLKAFARIDGILVALLWTASFACYIGGMAHPALMIVGMGTAVSTPFFVFSRLRRFRNSILDGTLSFGRGYLYSAHTFLYAALLFALAQFVYFQFIDQGYLLSKVAEVLSDPVTERTIREAGMRQAVDETLRTMWQTRPIDYALSYFSSNIIIGLLLALPIAAVAKRADRQDRLPGQE